MSEMKLGSPAPRRKPRVLIAGLIAAVVVLCVALSIVTTSLLPRTPAPPISSIGPATAQTIADRLDAAVAAAITASRIDADTADDLRGKIAEFRESAGHGKAREKARELQKKINELLDDQKIDQHTASQLTAILQPFAGNE